MGFLSAKPMQAEGRDGRLYVRRYSWSTGCFTPRVEGSAQRAGG